MNEKLSSGILVGRPFGGVAILYKIDLSNHIKIIDCDCDRYVAIQLYIKYICNFVIHCVYFPCNSNCPDYIVDASNIISKIELNFNNYSSSSHLLAGDFNFVCADGIAGYDLFKSIIPNYGLTCCDNLNTSNVNYTYCHATLNQSSLLDHFFVSDNVKQSIVNYEIIDSGINLSDHLPVSCTLSIISFVANNDLNQIKKIYRDR